MVRAPSIIIVENDKLNMTMHCKDSVCGAMVSFETELTGGVGSCIWLATSLKLIHKT